MKFVKSLFLAVIGICVLFIPSSWGTCWNSETPGKVCVLTYDYECPSGCWCPGTGGYTSSTIAVVRDWCENSTAYEGSYSGAVRCSEVFPKAEGGSSQPQKYTLSGVGVRGCYGEFSVANGYYVNSSASSISNKFKKCEEGFYCPGDPNVSKYYYKETDWSQLGKFFCAAGYYKSNDSCVRCEPGTASDKQGEGNTECEVCPAGTCSSMDGYKCAEDKTGAKYCMKCPTGTYSEAVVDKEGNPIFDEYGDPKRNATCEQCTTGRIIYEKGLPVGCDVCPSGTYTDGSGTCQICLPGYFCPDGKGLYECKDGTTSSSGSATCLCDNGLEFYCPDDDYTKCGCKPCEGAGRYLDSKGCHECPTTNIPSECKVNTDGGIEGKDGNTCKFEESDDNTGINSCQISVTSLSCGGIYKYNSSKKAYVAYSIEAKANYYVGVGSTATDMQCKQCPSDKPFSDGGSGGKEQCYACGAGSCVLKSGESGGIDYCMQCSGGYICPAGSDGNAQQCKIAEDGIYGFEECLANTFSGDGASKCISCANGYVTTSSEFSEFSYCRKGNMVCYSANACKQQGLKICIGPSGTGSKQCSSWPSCIIEDKYNRIKTSSGKSKRTGSITWLGKS